MCDKDDTFDVSALSDRTSDEDFFIDDYSHLRLSYYQHRVNDTADDSNSSLNESKQDKSKIDEDERRRLREYYVSQIPDLPHPSYTVASIIASASQKMNAGNSGFIYEKKIQQGTKRKEDEVKFDPARRSTLKPNSML